MLHTMKYALSVVVGAAGLALAMTLAGCGGSKKMTATQTARYIERHVVTQGLGIHVKCRSGTYGWDYDCTLTGGAPKGSPQVRTYSYDVNDRKVTGFSG